MRPGASFPLLVLAVVAAGCGGPTPGGSGPAATARPGGEASGAPAAPDTLRVLAYNIHHGEGMDGLLDLERIAALVREAGPDVVTLQEVDVGVRRTGGVDQAAELGRLTGMTPHFGPFMRYQGGEYGMALLTAWPAVEVTNHRLPDGAEPRTALAARLRSPVTGREVVVVGVHLYRTEEERLAQARALSEALEGVTVPVILAGDFNSTLGSPVMERLGRAWGILDKGADSLTFPSYAPEREIDFVLARPTDAVRVLEHRLLDEPVISDHRPVLATLVLR